MILSNFMEQDTSARLEGYEGIIRFHGKPHIFEGDTVNEVSAQVEAFIKEARESYPYYDFNGRIGIRRFTPLSLEESTLVEPLINPPKEKDVQPT